MHPTLEQAILYVHAALNALISQDEFAATLKTFVHKQVVGSMIVHQGNVKHVGRDVFSKRMGVDLVAIALTGGGGSGGSFLQQATGQALKAGTRAGLNIVILGEKPEEAFKEAVKSSVVTTLSAQAAWEIGRLSPGLNYWVHKGAHFGPGFFAGLVLSEGDLEKAMASGVSASLSEMIAEGLPLSLEREARGNIAKIGTGLLAVMAQQDVGLSLFSACNAIDHNFMTQAIRLASTLTPKMLAAMGLSGMTTYEVSEWLKTHPLKMDLLPEGILWEDPGFMPEESQVKTLTTPLQDLHPWQEGYQGYKEALPLILVTPQAEDSIAYILTFDKKADHLRLSKSLSMGEFKSDIFTQKIHWTSPVGTQQTYPVYQRSDINWDMVRTEVKGAPTHFIGKTNAEAAKSGFAPELADGSFATIHHIGQKNIGPLVEASRRYHGIGAKNNGQIILHQIYGYGKKHPEYPVDHEVWLKEQKEYWKWRAKDDGK